MNAPLVNISESLRRIDATGFAAIEIPEAFGRVPRLDWIPITSLVIDPEYQREISYVGRKNIRHIAAHFNWSMFTPVIVAPVGGSQFAIVDGQHRTTAAALCRIEKVPCAIIEAVRGEQAAAFRAINGNTTRLHAIQLFHAAVSAGDSQARKVVEVCAAAGVKVARTLGPLKDHQTFCVSTIGKGIERHGEAIVILALQAIVHSGDGRSEELNMTIIRSVIEVFAKNKHWRSSEAALMKAFEELNLEDLWREATGTAARTRGASGADILQGLLTRHLTKVLPMPTEAAAP